MTILSSTVGNVANQSVDKSVWIKAARLRQGTTAGSVVVPERFEVKPVAGVLTTPELQPGPAVITWGIDTYYVTIPASGTVSWWSVLALAVGVPPGTSEEAIAEALQVYLDANPIEGAEPTQENVAPLITTSGATRTAVDTRVQTVGDARYAPVDAVPEAYQAKVDLSLGYVNKDVSVDKLKLNADASDAQSWNRAIQAAIATGRKRIIAPSSSYTLNQAVDLSGLFGVTIEGPGGESMALKSSANLNSAFMTTGACGDILFMGMGFEGNVVDDVPLDSPRRSRTTVGNGYQGAIKLVGDLMPGGPTYQVRNIKAAFCDFRNISSLPVFFQGIRGEAEAAHSRFYNCLDPGWIFNETAVARSVTSRKSADNGLSMSRGNLAVIVSDADIRGAAYHGIYIGGFSPHAGPKLFQCTGGVVRTTGRNSMHLTAAPKQGRVSSMVLADALRGPSDGPTDDAAGVGIWIDGQVDGVTPGSYTEFAEDIQINDVTIIRPRRGGIRFGGAKRLSITDNTIIDPGSDFLSDGTTAVVTNDPQQNFGIWKSDFASSSTDVAVVGNKLYDTRTTPIANIPVNVSGVGGDALYFQNTSKAFRQSISESSVNLYASWFFNSVTRLVGGSVAGSSGQTTDYLGRSGRANGYWLNGGAGARKAVYWQTGSVDRWELSTTGEAESGSNAGTNLELVSKDDAGATIATLLKITRSSGLLTWATAHIFNAAIKAMGGFGAAITAKTSNYAVTATDHTILASGTITITLPSAVTIGTGRIFKVKNTGAGSITVAVSASGGTIDGAATATLAASEKATFQTDGANWYTV